MRIQSITVNCYRSFGEQQNMLQVNPGVTTIVGMNACNRYILNLRLNLRLS